MTGPFQSEALLTADDLFTSAEYAFEGVAYQQTGFHSGTSPPSLPYGLGAYGVGTPYGGAESGGLVTYDAAFQQSAFGPPPDRAEGGSGGQEPGSLVADLSPRRQVIVTLVAGAHRQVMFDKRV